MRMGTLDRPFRWIVVGGGAAGCLLARHLAALGAGAVLLVEAGGDARSGRQRAVQRVPAWYPRAQGTSLDWGLRTVPQPELGGRSLAWPRGKTLGGSSAINALIYLQPSAADLLRWEQATGRSWLLQAPAAHCAQTADRTGRCAFSGLPLAPVPELHPWCQMFLEACTELGLQRSQTWTQSSPGTAGPYWLTASDGRRVTVADALQEPPVGELQILPRTLVARVLLDGTRAVGIETVGSEQFVVETSSSETSSSETSSSESVGSVRVGAAGERTTAIYGEEIILCAGAVASPLILQRSGIGCPLALKAAGIGCHVESPGVGANLQDHLLLPFVFQLPESLGLPLRFARLARKIYRETGGGPLASNLAEAGAVLPGGRIQLHVTPTHYLKYPGSRPPTDCMTVGVTPLYPASRGSVHATAADPGAAPRIDPGYLTVEADREGFAEARDWLVQLAGTQVWRSHGAELILPGPQRLSGAGWPRALRTYCLSLYHPVGSCRMGLDHLAVVDAQFRVRGVDRLRVADVSTLPDLPGGNTMAAAFLVAQLAAGCLGSGNEPTA
jgi:choline dehydrogenase